MFVEKSDKNGITMKLDPKIESFSVHRILDYVKYLEATCRTNAKQAEVDILGEEVNTTRLKKNGKKFMK